jgi:hypothetical protein
MARLFTLNAAPRAARVLIAALAAGLAAAGAVPAAAQAPAAGDPPVSETVAGLRPHRAIYELKLAERSEKSEIAAASGRLVYEFVGSPCDGYSTQFRFVTRLENTDGKFKLTDMRTSSFEDAAGRLYEFLNQNFVQEVMTEESRGTAKREDAKIVSALTRPTDRKIDVPKDANFPTQHMVKMIEAAKRGERIAQVRLYDGSEGGERLYDTTVIIGTPQEGAPDLGDETAADKPELAKVKRWPVSISYFDPNKKERGEDTPEYQLGFILYENGISRKLRLNYGDFSLQGRLSELQLIDFTPCK